MRDMSMYNYDFFHVFICKNDFVVGCQTCTYGGGDTLPSLTFTNLDYI